MKLASGETKDRTIEFRNACYARLKGALASEVEIVQGRQTPRTAPSEANDTAIKERPEDMDTKRCHREEGYTFDSEDEHSLLDRNSKLHEQDLPHEATGSRGGVVGPGKRKR